MTTGRINQVTTFRSAFAAIMYSRAPSAHFRDVEFIVHFSMSRSTAAQQTPFPLGEYLGIIEPANGITLISHSRTFKVRSPFPVREQRSPTFNEDYQRPATPKRHLHRHGGSPSG